MFTRIADRYRDSTAVVIGAGGIGAEIVRLLSPSVATLVIADRDPAVLDRLAVSAGPARIVMRQLDVRDERNVAELFALIESSVGTPDYLFYAVGVLLVEPFAETTIDQWKLAVDVNLNGAFYCTRAAAELMRNQGHGSILLLGSIAGTKARSGSRVNPVYNATKAAIAAFVNSTAMQFRRHGVRINCISPGPTATPMMDVQPLQVHKSVSEITLDGRMNNPDEVAELALFIAAHGRFTGEDVCMGGGAGLGG